MENKEIEKEKQTPFLKRVNEFERKNRELEEKITYLTQRVEIIIKSLRR